MNKSRVDVERAILLAEADSRRKLTALRRARRDNYEAQEALWRARAALHTSRTGQDEADV